MPQYKVSAEHYKAIANERPQDLYLYTIGHPDIDTGGVKSLRYDEIECKQNCEIDWNTKGNVYYKIKFKEIVKSLDGFLYEKLKTSKVFCYIAFKIHNFISIIFRSKYISNCSYYHKHKDYYF